MNPINEQAYQLFLDGTLCFADIEANGIRVDVRYLQNVYDSIDKKIKIFEKKTYQMKEVRLWKKIYGDKFNLNSNIQLERILFDEIGISALKETKKGRRSTDNESLKKINTRLTKNILKIRAWKKAKDTYLQALIREEVNGYIHPFFGLIGVRPFRSQSDHPNFQNIPIRDPIIGKLIRQAIIPRSGHKLVERDYKGIEVAIAQCYNQDPILLKNIKYGDMHRDAAMKCFILKKDQVTKKIRYLGKNKWVFPQFYGDWYGSCAESQWEDTRDPTYSLSNGDTLESHLKKKGIRDLEDFKNHLKKIEDWFWNQEYKIYTTWKKKWVDSYWKKGYFHTLTGFCCCGLMDERQVINYPIQGTAFHCLLWSLIQMNNFLKKYKMRSKIVALIHDCALTDEHPSEEEIISEEFNKIMTIDLVKHFPWITAPMKIETEKTEIDQSWWTKS